MTPDYFREIHNVLASAPGAPPDPAKIAEVMRHTASRRRQPPADAPPAFDRSSLSRQGMAVARKGEPAEPGSRALTSSLAGGANWQKLILGLLWTSRRRLHVQESCR